MKKFYHTPLIELSLYANEDVLTISGDWEGVDENKDNTGSDINWAGLFN